VINMLIFL